MEGDDRVGGQWRGWQRRGVEEGGSGGDGRVGGQWRGAVEGGRGGRRGTREKTRRKEGGQHDKETTDQTRFSCTLTGSLPHMLTPSHAHTPPHTLTGSHPPLTPSHARTLSSSYLALLSSRSKSICSSCCWKDPPSSLLHRET